MLYQQLQTFHINMSMVGLVEFLWIYLIHSQSVNVWKWFIAKCSINLKYYYRYENLVWVHYHLSIGNIPFFIWLNKCSVMSMASIKFILFNQNLVYQFDLIKLIKPFVDESCDVTLSPVANSGSIALANCFPNSTPHWSNELISQTIPCTKILCSYNAAKKINIKSINSSNI